MPPRSYYNDPRKDDFLAFATAYFPEEREHAGVFYDKFGVPFIADVKHLAAYVGVSPSMIRQILHKKAYHYRYFVLPKGDGTFRQIISPKTYLKVIQWWISDNILDVAPLGDCVHGFRRGRSYVTNAAAHLGANHILNVDVRQFFPSIRKRMIVETFQSLGYAADSSHVLSDLTSLNDEAPTGAPTSPAIGNIVLREFDEKLSSFAAAQSLKYTRYADDITLSSANWIGNDVLQFVSSLALDYGFKLNDGKTRFMGRGDRMEVTGVVINDGIKLPREWRNFARGLLFRVLQDPKQFYDQRHKVFGICGALKSVDPQVSQSITRLAEEALSAIKMGASSRVS